MVDIEKELGVAAPSSGQLNDIESCVQRAIHMMEAIAETEEALKAYKSTLRNITDAELPELMAGAGVSEFKTKDGVKVSIKDFINGSLPKTEDEREAAFNWLISNDAGDLIKENVSIEFGRGEHNFAGDVKDKLRAMGAEFKAKQDVHPQTLAAFARERMRGGEPIDLALLGLYAGRSAKIKVPNADD